MSKQEQNASMKLHAAPPQVKRLSRKMLIGVGVLGSAVIGGSLIYAFQSRHDGGRAAELYSLDGRNLPDSLRALPKDYTGPVLGNPLPGDLGAAMVDKPVATTAPVEALPTVDPYEAELKQKLRQEGETARTATLFTESQTKAKDSGSSHAGGDTSLPVLPDFTPVSQMGGNDHASRQQAFLDAKSDTRTVSSERIAAPASRDILQAGSVIPAALLTGIRSDLPGQITAQVTQNIYDSPTGRILLIPQGTRLIGQYDNAVAFGQSRVLFVWNRLIFANGRSIVLERQPGADASGYAGVQDKVDYHWWQLTKAAALSTLLSVGSELAMDDDDDRLVRAIRNGAQDTFNDAGQKIVDRQLNIAPTLTVRPGFPIRVIITRDIVLEPYSDASLYILN
ncbi:TrbI/VirB10 family protein [uncultured Bartonella sp.]|uniref:TrbI/VirB10 family protein n=1 Tax=uncultured Bartonella sp. TaxID=104108 RepID=UPI002634E54B|nr:TrbI/VirB10 family protein [uncultured Bartonella sp.]